MSDSESESARDKYYRMKRSRVQPEALIAEVRTRPELWNFSCIDYRDKTMKKRSWDAICTKLIEGYKQLPAKERQTIAKDMTMKWKGYRDAYIKDLRKCQRNGEEELKYIHADLLSFLGLTVRQPNRQAVSTTSHGIENITQDDSTSLDQMEGINLEPTVSIKMEDFDWSSQSGQKRSLDEYYESDNDSEPLQKRMYQDSQKHMNDVFIVDDNLPSAQPQPVPPGVPTPEDDDMSFFKSVMPAVKDLTKFQKMSFRIQVMQILQSFANST